VSGLTLGAERERRDAHERSLLNAEVAHQSNRGYVFEEYQWMVRARFPPLLYHLLMLQ
jgi:hypothetical protein